jgi:hypothetical protein
MYSSLIKESVPHVFSANNFTVYVPFAVYVCNGLASELVEEPHQNPKGNLFP